MQVLILLSLAFMATVPLLVGLLDPLKVKGITLRNRIVMPPMQSGRASFEGAVTNKLINFYVRRSSALGMPIVEHAYVSLTGKIGPKQLGIYDDSLLSGFEKLASAIHSAVMEKDVHRLSGCDECSEPRADSGRPDR